MPTLPRRGSLSVGRVGQERAQPSKVEDCTGASKGVQIQRELRKAGEADRGRVYGNRREKGGALPQRQASCPGIEGINNYRHFPHSFPQEAGKTATTHVGSTEAESSLPRTRWVRKFSPSGGAKPLFVPL